MEDPQLERLLTWLASAGARASGGELRPGFRPHRLQIDLEALGADFARGRDKPWASEHLFGFMDRATTSRHDQWSGDFDLLACLGFRVIGIPRRTAVAFDDWPSLSARARTLRVTMVVEPGPARTASQNDAPSPGSALTLQPFTLTDFFQTSDEQLPPNHGTLPVIADHPGGESWPESLARRGLYRGATGGAGAVVTGWCPPRMPGSTLHHPTSAALAMWVHALDGQRLGMIEGWRDLRDGSGTPYPSLTSEPAIIEAMAFAALDMLYFRDRLDGFSRHSVVAVVVGPECIHPSDPNRWARPHADLFAALVARGIRFDVVPQSRLSEMSPDVCPDAVLITSPDEALPLDARRALGRMTGGRMHRVLWQPGTNVSEAVVAAQRLLPSANPADLAVSGPGDSPASALLVFHAADGSVAVANPTDRQHTVRIAPRRHGPTPPLHDLLSGEDFSHPDRGLTCRPWQVRLLVPAKP